MKTKTNLEGVGCGRFSSGDQDEGDSRARQGASFVRLCKRWELQPSTRFSIFDAARSAFKGKHLSTAAQLGAFLDKVERGIIAPLPGSRIVLVYEAVDRLTRLHPLDANALFTRLVNLGLVIVFDEGNMWIDRETIADHWVTLQCLIEQAWRYSERLSKRMLSAHAAARDEQRRCGKCPSWISWNAETGKHERKEPLWSTMKQAIAMAVAGHGTYVIRRKLGLSTGLSVMLRKRTLLGEYQPCKQVGDRRIPCAEPLPGFYPALCDAKTFARLQLAIDKRSHYVGRRGEMVTNLFRDLCFDAVDGSKMVIRQSRKVKSLRSNANVPGHKHLHYDVVERHLLGFLKEIRLKDIMPPSVDQDAIETEIEDLTGRIAILDSQAKTLIDTMGDEGDGTYIATALGKLQKDKNLLTSRLDDLSKRSHAASPSAQLQECRNLVDGLARASGAKLLEMRTRLRSIIASLVSEIWILVSDVDHAEIQIFLNSGVVRWTLLDGEQSVWACSEERWGSISGNHDLRTLKGAMAS